MVLAVVDELSRSCFHDGQFLQQFSGARQSLCLGTASGLGIVKIQSVESWIDVRVAGKSKADGPSSGTLSLVGLVHLLESLHTGSPHA